MTNGTEFCLLGPLVVRIRGGPVLVRRGKQRTLLAALLLQAGRVISHDDLAEALWGPDPPPSARVTVQNYVMRLRRALGDSSGSLIGTRPRGYVICIDSGDLDVSRFEARLSSAWAAAREGSWATAADQARAALAIWRGEPLADIESESLLLREVPRLTELRLQALETRIDAEIHLGQHTEVIGELRQLTDAHSLRERPHALLVLALYHDGRQAEALSAYQHARQLLRDELGTEPGTELRELHQRILRADPGLAAPRRASSSASPRPASRVPVPRELPAAIRHFTGRAVELDILTRLLEQPGEQAPGTVVISAIGGTAGVGKTALAVYWAHRVADRFPDGQLYVNLRGYDSDRPVTAGDALARFLRALGVPGQDIPPEADERATRYRSLLSGRRALVVLDNAGSVEQVRPLLPGTPSCTVVVTSRDSLAGLVAREGAQRLDLDVLAREDAFGLLRTLIGHRVDAEPGAAEALAEYCCQLPLALRIAAELAVARPACSLAELADELAHQQRRLDMLDAGGDPRTAIRTVFSWSCGYLEGDTARAFGLMGLHPGADLDCYALAALVGTGLERAAPTLDVLTRAHLIQVAGPSRYAMHDLLRAYARELAVAQVPEQERHAALTRLFDYYASTSANAMDTIFPAERHRRPRIPAGASAAPALSDQGTARGWLDAERANLVAITAYAADNAWPGHAARLTATLFRYLETANYYAELIAVHASACRAARRTGDCAAEAAAMVGLGIADWEQHRPEQAISRLEQALVLFQKAGDRAGEARVLNNLGQVEAVQGHYQQANDYTQRSMGLHRQAGDTVGVANALRQLGDTERLQGNYEKAIGYLRRSLALCRQAGDRSGAAHALHRLGFASLQLERYEVAARYLRESLEQFCQIGGRGGEADSLICLGDIAFRLRQFKEAADDYYRPSLALCREIGDKRGEAQSLSGIGDVHRVTGQAGLARNQYSAALSVASELGAKDEEARAHEGLGDACEATGDSRRARHHWREALALYTELGSGRAAQLRAQLSDPGDDKRAD